MEWNGEEFFCHIPLSKQAQTQGYHHIVERKGIGEGGFFPWLPGFNIGITTPQIHYQLSVVIRSKSCALFLTWQQVYPTSEIHNCYAYTEKRKVSSGKSCALGLENSDRDAIRFNNNRCYEKRRKVLKTNKSILEGFNSGFRIVLVGKSRDFTFSSFILSSGKLPHYHQCLRSVYTNFSMCRYYQGWPLLIIKMMLGRLMLYLNMDRWNWMNGYTHSHSDSDCEWYSHLIHWLSYSPTMT